MKYFGNLYCGDLKESIEDYTKKHGTKPKTIYCNKEEFEDTSLKRVTTMRFPKGNYVLTYRKE